MGTYIIRNGDKSQRISTAYYPMSQFYNLNKKLFYKFNVLVDKNVTMSGCFKSNKVTFQRTMISEIESDMSGLPRMSKIKVFKNSLKSTIHKLKIIQLTKCYKEDMLVTSFNGKSFSGVSYKEYYTFESKEEGAEVALSVANKH
jgi:hypothetical protein